MKTATRKIETGIEPIPGYTVIRKLGTGGYGEVWSAEAPGGIEKAIKFVYGNHDSERASRELKSLNRMKGINHPFLISLERYEIVHGQLVIVTELASGSLEDVFHRHRQRGSCGIPKRELLDYLHDAADGLDYLHREFQLQHLDVKPGNLLLVGGHVKVGDFGLLKDLSDVECSMVGGLTPIYAAPEVFDGQPHGNSDQYSLAVMYQELLTGHRPFAGRTIAQLATQHIHSVPNLDALPATDRPIVARALEKDPNRRYATCRELISRLQRADDPTIHVPNNLKQGDHETTTLSGKTTSPIIPNHPRVNHLPAVDGSEADQQSTAQVLVIGLGGTGNEVVQKLCIRQSSAHRECDLRAILIDTDDAAIYDFREFEIASNLVCNVQRLCFPIRTPHDYREQSGHRFSTISRRWIYNVPKTRRTEGLRPLGRLALIDHAEHLKRVLQQSINELRNDGTPVRAYVVSSLAGGTGSGMYADVAFVLRRLLDESGFAAASVRPILVSPTFDSVVGVDALQRASAHAALAELQYFMLPKNGYPEDKANAIDAVPAARSPIHEAYVVARSPDKDAIGQLTDYLWYDAFVSSSLFDLARQHREDRDSPTRRIVVRSFGIAPLETRPTADLATLRFRVVDQVIRDWMGNPKRTNPSITLNATEALDSIGVSPEKWASVQLQGLLGTSVSDWQRALEHEIGEALASLDAQETLFAKEAVIYGRAKIQPLIALATKSQEQFSQLETIVEQATINLQSLVADRLLKRKLNLFGAVELVRQIHKHCFQYAQDNENSIAEMKSAANHELHRLMNDLSEHSLDDVDVSSIVTALNALMRAEVQKSNGILFEEIGDKVKLLEAKLLTNARELARIHQTLHEQGEALSGNRDSTVESKILPAIATKLHDHFSAELLLGSLQSNRAHEPRDASKKLLDLCDTAKKFVEDFFGDVSGNGILTTEELESIVQQAVTIAAPELLRFGGKQRLMLIGNDQGYLDKLKPFLEKIIGHEISTSVSEHPGTVIVHEASDIPIDSMLGKLAGELGDDVRASGRLMTRCDLSWGAPMEVSTTTTHTAFKTI